MEHYLLWFPLCSMPPGTQNRTRYSGLYPANLEQLVAAFSSVEPLGDALTQLVAREPPDHAGARHLGNCGSGRIHAPAGRP